MSSNTLTEDCGLKNTPGPLSAQKKGRREQIQTAFFMPYWFASRIVYRRFPLLRPRPTTTSPISPKPSNSSIAGSGALVTMS
jgi:hypothetical protein